MLVRGADGARTSEKVDNEVGEGAPYGRRSFFFHRRGRAPASAATRTSRRFGRMLLLPLLLFVLGMYLYPTYLRHPHGLREHRGGSVHGPVTGTYDGVANYRYLLGSSTFWSALGHTALFAIVTVPLQVFFGFLIALLFNRPAHRYSVLRALLLVPWLLPHSDGHDLDLDAPTVSTACSTGYW